MLLPFDHVWIGDMEFILLFPNKAARVGDRQCHEWRALDVLYSIRVIIRDYDMVKIPSQCSRYGTRIHKPVFYRERIIDGHFERCEILNLHMVQNETRGEYEEDGRLWDWDLCSMTVHSCPEKWDLRVMTPGGVWL